MQVDKLFRITSVLDCNIDSGLYACAITTNLVPNSVCLHNVKRTWTEDNREHCSRKHSLDPELKKDAWNKVTEVAGKFTT
jgi:hypothetical protein